MTDHARRIAGAMLGLALGLLYGLVSGYINSIVMAGVPLRVDTPAILADAIFAGGWAHWPPGISRLGRSRRSRVSSGAQGPSRSLGWSGR